MLRLDGASARRHEPVRALTHARARHWTPAAAKCIIGAVQGLRRAGRVLARPGAAPLRRLRRHLPLQGRLYGQLPLKKAPLQGELDAPQGAARGVHCRLAVEISCKARQNPALCFVGDDLRAKSRHFVPAALRNAACGRQCSHRPAEPCGGLPSPLCRPCVPHCRAGVHARRGTFRPPAARKAPLQGELAAPQGAA